MIWLMDNEPISVRPLDLAVAAEVRADMARWNFTISGMAAAVNMNRAPFTERYHGRRPFAPSELQKVAARFGATASDILARAESAAPAEELAAAS
ncbi:hypothetical protein APR04_003770 [Promicromonospora umidemergens]|uniref:HTH cro/C1-type domain-containing protein n=2 Tax=Promicromonospora umidemergens TaxID=629679 RepID=A0ABP8XGQ8_9MICO|nr:hypothetical protein [Promicromonospora umidemergens]